MPVTGLRTAVGDWLPDNEVAIGGGIGGAVCSGEFVAEGLDEDVVVKGGAEAPPLPEATARSREDVDVMGGGGGGAPAIVADISSFFLR